MKKLKCNVGNYQCGGKCQPNNWKCKKIYSQQLNFILNNSVNLINNSSSRSNNNYLFREINDYYQKLPEENKLIFPQNVGVFKDDVAAWGMQAYFSENYPLINKYFYDDNYRLTAPLEIKMMAEAAKYGFNQLPNFSTKEIQDHYREKGINYDGKTLYRGVSNLNPDFFNKYINLHVVGEILEYRSFTSTSVANPNDSKQKKVDGSWGNKPIQIKIIRKTKNSAGKWVDKRKRSKDEGEILFPPGQRFKVVSIEKVEYEKLPNRLRNPLLDIFKSTSEGFGIENLKLSAILGELKPQELVNNPNYSWLLSFLKKKNIISVENWTSNTTIGELFSVAKMLGGKAKFFEEIAKSLSSQIKEGERTLETEIFSANIILEEV